MDTMIIALLGCLAFSTGYNIYRILKTFNEFNKQLKGGSKDETSK